MKVTPRFTVRAALVLTAAGVIGVFGACKKDVVAPPPPPPSPPPPASVAAPTGLSATAASGTRIDLAWTDNASNETGFRVERCSGAGCTNFAQIGANTAADVKAFADEFGLVVGTSYSYRVQAFNATASSGWSGTATTITPSPQVPSPILVGAGEISSCLSSSGPTATAAIINGMLSDPNVTVFSAGDALSDAAAPDFSCFDSKWGAFKDRTVFALGTGDYTGRGADVVYNYFGERTGPRGKGYRSFDLGTWHILLLNTTTYELGTDELTNAASAFNTWLVNDLQANTQPCVMAISWQRRLYTSGIGSLGKQGNMKTISEELYAAGVDVLVSANDHLYERFPQTDSDGNVDVSKGFRQFVVGTGGMTTWAINVPVQNQTAPSVPSNVEKQGNAWGVIKFTLNANSYKWEFIPTVTGGFTDSGETNCH
jgi:hypothetical protein